MKNKLYIKGKAIYLVLSEATDFFETTSPYIVFTEFLICKNVFVLPAGDFMADFAEVTDAHAAAISDFKKHLTKRK